jgi:hypothetical protein
MPCGRIATSPYTIQCVAKLRVARQDSGPFSTLFLVKFLVIPGIRKELVADGCGSHQKR